jgi:hypothetical protein
MMARRPGTSLVEVMAAMSANAVLTGVAVVALLAIGRADREVNARLDDRRSLTRFAHQLRTDIHAAEQLTWDDPKRTVCLSKAGGDYIEYRADKSQWSRHSSTADEAAVELTSAFRMPRSLRVEFDPTEAGAGELIRVRLSDATAAASDASRSRAEELIIQVGSDARLLHP